MSRIVLVYWLLLVVVMVTVEVNLSDGLADLGGLSKEMIQSGLSKTAQDLISNLQINSPVDHGLLKQWAVTEQSDTEITIQSPAEYAGYVNYGTSRHWVEPVSAKALHWEGTGMMYAGGLMHSHGYGGFSKGHFVGGIQARHFVEDSIEQTQARISEFFTINGG